MERQYTEEEARRITEEWLRQHNSHPFDTSDEGEDLSLLRENLRLSPTERMLRYQSAAQMALEFFNAGKRAGLHHVR